MKTDHENPGSPMSAHRTSEMRILRLKEVCKVTGLGRSFIYQLQSEGKFPHGIKISVRSVGWLESEVREWIKSRIESSRSNA